MIPLKISQPYGWGIFSSACKTGQMCYHKTILAKEEKIMKLRRVLTILLVLALGIGAWMLPVSAAKIVDKGSYNGTIYWTLDSSGTMTVSGEGAIPERFLSNQGVARDAVKMLVIQEGITEIGTHAFIGAYRMKQLQMPKSLQVIGGNAFCDCSALTVVTIPAGVKQIGDSAFGCIGRLYAIIFRGNAPKIYSNAFEELGASGNTVTAYYPAKNSTWKTDVFRDYGGHYIQWKPISTVKITTQPKTCYTQKGKTAKVTVKAEGESLSYQWYVKNAGASQYTKSSNQTAIYKATMDDVTKDRQVYCIITDVFGNTVKTNTVTLRMAATIVAQPKNVLALKGSAAKVSVQAAGDGLSYKWYYKNKNSTKFSLTKSFQGNTYTLSAINADQNGRQVYCVVTDKYGKKAQSDTVTLTMKQVAKITTQPKNVTVANGKEAKVSVKAVGDGLSYKWYYKDAGKDKFSLTKSFTGNTYSISAMDKSRSGRQVYCVVTDKYGNKVQTNTVTIRMSASIVTQPKNVTVVKGKEAKVTVKAVGDGLTYKWYYKDAGKDKFSLTKSFTGNSYSISEMDAKRSGRQVYCVVTDKYGNKVQTDTVTLRVATIYLNKSGSKYHYDRECAGKTAYESTLKAATKAGKTPCKTCVH